MTVIPMKNDKGSGLKIARNLILPAEAVTEKLAFLGRTGSGKTYAAQKVAEEMLGSGAQVVALDPVGVWYGLRIAADGKSPGIPIPVFGGLHGDIPLEAGAGAMIADLIVDRRISAVIDVSQFEFETEKARFAAAFAQRFFFRRKANPAATMLFLEECQEFIPQNPEKAEAHMLHDFTRIAKIGRNYGIGLGMISQRPQEINKKVLNLTECMFAFQMTGPHERKTIRSWVEEKGSDVGIVDALPKLAVGQAHVWSPVLLKISETVNIGRKWTFNASSTPTLKEAQKAEPRPLESSDMERLRKDMAVSIEKAKADDPRELRKRIQELERELARKTPATIDPQSIARAREEGAEWAHRLVQGQKKTAMQRVRAALELLEQELLWLQMDAPVPQAQTQPPPRPPAALPVVKRSHPAAANNSGSSAGSLKAPERRILTVLAQRPEGVELDRLAILAGYTVNGHFNNTLGGLRTQGLISPPRVTPITITEEGLQELGHFEPLPTGHELQQYWLQKLSQPEQRILQVLLDRYPRPLDLEELATEAGYTVNGHFNNTMGGLRTKGLISPPRQPILASKDFFEG